MSDFGILNNLVTQFTSALDCFRELVQNAIDAGSMRVDVWTEYVGDTGKEGAIVVHVDDWGEGMDRGIIDQQFTRLFSSTKRSDLTQIGKFGIGFVSVFAMDPRAVIVRTGKDGRYWEVFFHHDRTFQITAIEEPVEGTQISLVLAGDIHRYSELVPDIRKTLTYWCRHVEAEIGFEDRTPADGSEPRREIINEPFEVEGLCAVQVVNGTTEMALAYSLSVDEEPDHSFFNGGLTLASGQNATGSLGRWEKRFGHIRFKVSSPLFEHTLTRETVIQDEHFERGMEHLNEAAGEELLSALLDKMEEVVARRDWSIKELELYNSGIMLLTREPTECYSALQERRILRLVDGGSSTPQEMYQNWRRDGRVLVSESPSELLTELLSQGLPIFWGRPPAPGEGPGAHSPVKRFLRRFLDFRARRTVRGQLQRATGDATATGRARPVVAPEDAYLPVFVDREVPDEFRPLFRAAAAKLEEVGSGFRRIGTCRVASTLRDVPIFVVSRELGSLMARPPAQLLEERRPFQLEAAINRDHRHVRRLNELFKDQPQIATMMLVRCLFLPGAQESHPGDELDVRSLAELHNTITVGGGA